MAGVTFGGLATGLSTDDIVTKLMAVNRLPIDKMTKDKDLETTKLKAYSQLNTRLQALQEAADAMNITSEVRTTKAELSSEANFTATASNTSTGSYTIGVAQLAQVQKNVSATGYDSSSTTTFKTGSLTLSDGTGKALATLTIDSTNNTLAGIKAAINAQTGTTGVTATIIGNANSKYHLVLTGKDASTSFSLTDNLTSGTGESLSTTKTQSAQQAVVIIDGVAVTSNSNTVTDAISGVTLNLSTVNTSSGGSSTGTEDITKPWTWAKPPTYASTTMNITGDASALKEKITTFVSSYNSIMSWINEGYKTKTSADTTSTSKTTSSTSTSTSTEDVLSDYLRGDSTVSSIKRNLQSILTGSINTTGSAHALTDLGISTNKDGTLTVNSSKLDTALKGDVNGLVSLLAGEGTTDGVMKKFNTYLTQQTGAASGMYATKKSLYTKKAAKLDDQIATKETLMTKIEATMRARFNAMELMVSNLNSQSTFLTQWTAALNKSS